MFYRHNFGSFHQSVKVDGKVYTFDEYKILDHAARAALRLEAVDRCCKANQAQSAKLRDLATPIRAEYAAKRKALPKVRGRVRRSDLVALDRAEQSAIEETRHIIPTPEGNSYPGAVHDVFRVWEEKVETPWEKFERLVKNHDWYYNYSDDHGVWAGGNRVHTEIRKLMAELGEPAVKLYNQECPWLNEDGTQKEGA